MKFVFASYVKGSTYKDSEAWITRIRAYTSILEALGANNEIISIEQIDYEGEYFKNGVRYIFRRFNKAELRVPIKLNRFIKQLKPDVVFIQSLHFPLQVILLRLAIGRKPGIIIQNHAEKPFTGIKKYLLRWADKYIDAYLFASKDMGMDWVTKGNIPSPGKIHEVMEVSSVFYPVDKSEALKKTDALGQPVFLWVGRLDKNKDPLTVVKAFIEFIKLSPPARLYMIYHTEELLDDIKNALNKHHISADTITLIGTVPNEEMLYWYNSADFIISGSHYEGSGTAVCEAMSCGCVPVVTDIFSFRMMTNNGNIGLLYEAGNVTALVAVLKQTRQLDMHDQKRRGLAYFRSTLSFEAIAGKIQVIAASC
jgi:glycosyltransferase involved in cell wall biosynthesis